MSDDCLSDCIKKKGGEGVSRERVRRLNCQICGSARLAPAANALKRRTIRRDKAGGGGGGGARESE